jgi:hypothetical protein
MRRGKNSHSITADMSVAAFSPFFMQGPSSSGDMSLDENGTDFPETVDDQVHGDIVRVLATKTGHITQRGRTNPNFPPVGCSASI